MNTSSKPTAIDDLIAAKADIDAMLARLAAYSDDHFGVSPDDVNWGDAGSARAIAVHLRRACDFAFSEGENAP